MGRSLIAVLPGLLLVFVLAATARVAHGLLPSSVGRSVGEVLVAVILGLAVGNTVRLGGSLAPGIRASFHHLLRAAIVLLGAQLSLSTVAAIGGKALLMIVCLMSLALSLTHLLGRRLRITPELSTLIGVGTAVCGNTAISAAAPVIGARDEDISFAIATNTLFGTLAVFAYPLLGTWLGLGDAAFGTWAGTAVNDTSQVVATGFAVSEEAGRVATTVKLTRNALMAAVIVGLAFLHRREVTGQERPASWWRVLQRSIPAFVLGFLAMSLLNTFGLFAWVSEAVGRDLLTDLKWLARALILMALTGVGLSTSVATMRRTGAKPFLVGLTAASVTSLASLLLIRLLGPAGG
jgi:uncharacterized integral membrane protein (TIGR00698 family)